MKLIVDGNNLVCSAYFVQQESENVVQNVVSLFKVMIEKLKRDFSTEDVYIAWDGRGGTAWRKEILPEYKATRVKEGKDELFASINSCHDILEHNNFHFDDFEGDDTIYALCRALDGEKIIISADKDFLQIVQEGLADKLFNQIQKKYREIPEICSIVEKAICGDSSDNLAGVKNRGPAFLKKFVKREVRLTEAEQEVYEKHKLVIGLKNNPHKNELLELVEKQLTIS